MNIIFSNYQIADFADASFPKYYGYTDSNGDWYIMKIAANGDTRYHRKTFSPIGLYSSAWAARTTLEYFYWDTTF